MANGAAIKVISVSRSPSTPVTNLTPAQASSNELELALRGFETAATGFGTSIIKDPAARADYAKRTAAVRDELLSLVKQGKVTPHEAAKTANAMRNQIMEMTRLRITDLGLSISKELKAQGRSLEYMEDLKAKELFNKPMSALSASEKQTVWVKIVESAGKSNLRVNNMVKIFGQVGKGFLVASLAFAIYNVATTPEEDRPRQAAKEGTIAGGGMAGAALGSIAVAAMVSNPAGWVVGVSMFVGACVTAAGAAEAFDRIWPEDLR